MANAATEIAIVTSAPCEKSRTWFASNARGPDALGALGAQPELLLPGVPEPVRSQDRLELAVADHRAERVVDGSLEIRRVLPNRRDVDPARNVARYAENLLQFATVEIRDDVIEQHGVDALVREIEVGFLLSLVERNFDGMRLQQIVRHRLVQRRDALAVQLCERARTGTLPHGERLAVHEVGDARENARASRGRVLEAVQRDVEIASLERRDEVRPVVLDEARPNAEPAGKCRGDVDFETPDPVAARILEDVGGAALEVAAPGELAATLELRERRGTGGRREECDEKSEHQGEKPHPARRVASFPEPAERRHGPNAPASGYTACADVDRQKRRARS